MADKKTNTRLASLRRLTALMLALITLLAYPEPISANRQSPIRHIPNNPENYFDIYDRSSTTVNSPYSLELTWHRPPISTQPDPNGSSVPPNDATPHTPTGYDILRRNISRSEAYLSTPDTTVTATETQESLSYTYSNLSLTRASLYLFKITPFHFHKYSVVDAQTGLIREESRRAPAEPGVTDAETIYLTDIRVTAEGRGNNLVVTWDNPQYEGANAFSGYRIRYKEGNSSAPYFDIDDPVLSGYDVGVDDPNLVYMPDGSLQYTFVDDKLIIGQTYVVKVEPLMGAEVFRKLKANGREMVSFNGSEYYNLAFHQITREYRDVTLISPHLYDPTVIGDNSIRFYWDGMSSSTNIQKIEIRSSYGDDVEASEIIGTLQGNMAINVTHWEVSPRPDRETNYWIIIYDGTGKRLATSNMVTFKEVDPFTPYKPDIVVSVPAEDQLALLINWEVFARNSNYPDEADKEIFYDIWISDSLAMLDNIAYETQPIESLDARALPAPIQLSGYPEKWFYSWMFQNYYPYDKNTQTIYPAKAIDPNKVYYIRIRARRSDGQKSQNSYSTVYVPAVGSLSPVPLMSSKPPLRIRLDQNALPMIGPNSVNIEWANRWFEAFSEGDDNWYSQIAWDASAQKIVFGEEATIYNTLVNLWDIADAISDTETLKTRLLNIWNDPNCEEVIDKTAFRLIDLRRAGFEVYVVKYDEMINKYGSYENFMYELNKYENKDLAGWQILQESDSDAPITTALISGLEKNTAYALFFRPFYRINDEKIPALFPSFLSVTTMEVREDVIITPTVPILIGDAYDDKSLTVKWEYSSLLEYTLSYSDTMSRYPDSGLTISFEDIVKDGRKVQETVDGVVKDYYYYTIDNLFPDTVYYIWIYAIADNNGNPMTSQPSNPVLMKTSDLVVPSPPKGLGPASNDSVETYNMESKVALKRIEPSYFIIEWMRDYNDRSEGTASDGFPTVLLSPTLISTYMAMVGSENAANSIIKPNTEYYIRAKTILTVSRVSDGHATRSYNYLIEVARDSSFEDIVGRGYVPARAVTDPDPYNDRRLESGWSETVTIKTGKSQDEYDSDADEKTHPLPVQDFDITFDSATGTLNFRFRTNLTDSAGNRDNSVDQRFISNLISQQIGIYTLDLSNYENRPISTRVVEIPYSIMKAFDDRRIPFELKAGNLTMVLMPGSLNIPQIFELKDFESAVVKVTLTQNPSNTPLLNPGESYLGSPQRVALQVVSPSRTINPASLSSPMQMSLRLDSAATLAERNVAVYAADSNSGGWQRLDANYVPGSGVFSFKTQQLATFGTISRPLPIDTDVNRQSDASYNVMTQLDIRDMPVYKGSDYINSNQLNNIVAAIAKGDKSASINSEIGRDDYDSLNKAGYLVPSSSTVQRQAGIYTLVRLYELKTQTAVKNYSNQASSPYADISLADQKYKEALYKAESLGFFGNRETADPRASLTIADVLYMIDIIMGDAGM